MPDLIRHPEILKGVDVLARFALYTMRCRASLTPPPFGRLSGVYPDENRGQNDDHLETVSV